MLSQDPTGNSVPTFETVRLGRDHTTGLNPGFSSPAAMMADNDYAVGELVDAVSKSPIWESTVIFVIEDDSQFSPNCGSARLPYPGGADDAGRRR